MKKKEIYQIKITLKGYSPKIWRRLLVYSDTDMCELHEIVQTTMGWWNEHLHQFIKDRVYYVEELDPDFDFGTQIDYTEMTVSDLLTSAGDKMEYEYDFGDSWKHEVLLEKILKCDPNADYPVCIGGKNNCPPEDCGGVSGYQNFVKIITNPKNPEYEEMLEWVGGSFDPTYFNIDEINEALL